MTNKDALGGTLLPYVKESCTALAEGNVALIITGMMGVGVNSCAADFMPKTYAEGFSDKLREIVAAVHDKGGKIVVQISHCGANAMVLEEGENPWAPSDITSVAGYEAKEMTKEQIDRVVKDFGKAAKLCKGTGADGVQLHCAHGYLLSQFLSPYYNKRSDAYGGSIENRARIVFETYSEVREQVGESYPVMIKINYSDLIGEEGLLPEESTWVCRELSKRGIDAIEVSSGIARTKETRPSQKHEEGAMEGHFTEGALKLSAELDTAIISVGGYRTREQIEHILNKGNIAAIAMSRPFADPMYIAGWDN